jgi:AcrR family transcriptional regulator
MILVLQLSPVETYGNLDLPVKEWQPCGHFVKNRPERYPETSMAVTWQKTRKTFRHGNLAEALVDSALERLEADGVEKLSLRELASDAGVNHRAVYRHFPDKLSLLARVAEEGWRRLERRVRQQLAGKPKAEKALAAASVGFYLFARDNPNLFTLMAGPRINKSGAFPSLEAAMAETMAMFRQPFVDVEIAPELARIRTAVFVSALQGITTQILHGRLHVSREKARDFVAHASQMLFKGLR